MTRHRHRAERHPNRRCPRQLLPGPADGAHPGIRESAARRRHRRLSLDTGSKTDIPKWVEKAGHRLVERRRAATATTRSSSRRPAEARDEADPHPRRRRRRHADRQPPGQEATPPGRRPARSTITVVDQTGRHTYQPGFMYIAMGGERAEQPPAPGARPARSRESTSSSATVVQVDEPTPHRPPGRRPAPCATTSSCSRPARASCPRRSSTSTPRPTTSTRAEAALELRQALDAFTGGRIVIGIAGMPYKCPPAPLEVAFLIEAELRERGLREKSEVHFCSPIGRAFTIESVSEMATPILEAEGHRAPHVLQRRDDRSRSARSSRASRARSSRTTCSSSCRPTRASSS